MSGPDGPARAELQLLTVAVVAERLALHVKTVRRLIARGDLRAVRIGTAVRVHPDDLEELVNRKRERAAPPPAPLRAVRGRTSSVSYADRVRSGGG